MDDFNNQTLTKKQRRLLRKQQREQERLSSISRKKIKKAVFIFLPIVLIAGGIVFSWLSYSPSENQGTPKIEIVQKEYDAGTVSMADGVVKHTYEIKNTGDSDLKINRIWTSCMCTTAVLRVGDKKSPKFGMHDNPAFWSQTIAPEQAGFLEVEFDPAFHGPQGVGLAVRAVYLSTNDPENKKAEVKLSANVIR
jgi:hypothetical protein